LLADGRGEDDRAARDDPGRRERAGEGEEDGEAAAVVRDPGPAEPAIPAPDRHVGFRWEDRVQVRGNEDGRGFVDRWIGSGRAGSAGPIRRGRRVGQPREHVPDLVDRDVSDPELEEPFPYPPSAGGFAEG